MLESFITFSNTHNSWFQIHKQWGHQQIIGHLLSLSGTSPQRPTAKELLKHKFITRYTKKTAYLTELIDRYRRWKSEGHGEESSSDDSDMWVKQVIHQKRSKRVHAGDTDPISCRMIKSTLLKDIHRKSFRLWEILLKTYFLWKAKQTKFYLVTLTMVLFFLRCFFQGCWWWCRHVPHVDLPHS